MEIDKITESGAASSGPGSVAVLLHPLVILNISEHWTRNKVKENSTAVVVYGALLGKQEGHHVEISNSFELLIDEPNFSLNTEFYITRETQCKQVYPDLDIVGWYTTGGVIEENDQLFNRQMQELNESPLILKLDPLTTCGEQLPIRIYESVVDNDGKIHFRQVLYTLATNEAERIGIDYVARIPMSNAGRSTSMTAEHLLGSYQAVQMLSNRLQLIKSYVSAVSSGELQPNRSIIRDIHALTERLSLISPSFSNEYDNLHRQANDVCLTALLSNITQGLHKLYGCMVKTTQVIHRRSIPVSSGSISNNNNIGRSSKLTIVGNSN